VAEELENIGDVISKSLVSSLTKCIEYNIWFSDQDWAHIVDFHGKIKEAPTSALEAFREDDLDLAQKIEASREEITIYYKALHIAHLQKYHSGIEETIHTSSLYLDILAEFRQLHHLSANIASSVVDFKEALETE